MAKPNLTLERLREVLSYDPETGVLVWTKCSSHLALVGKIAGTVDRDGYIRIGINRTYFKAHRLAWFYVTGEWPHDEIDHIDGIKANNRFRNLRNATRSQNMQNISNPRLDSKSGVRGVHPDGRFFSAKIKINGTNHYLGYFATAQEAHAAYVDAKRRMHEYDNLSRPLIVPDA